VRSTASGPIVSVSTHYTRTHYEHECVIEQPFLDELWLYRSGIANIMKHPRHLWIALDGLREGLGLVPHRPWPNQPYWPGSTVYDDRINWFSRAYFWALLLPALIHAFVRPKARYAPAEFRFARRLSWMLLASVGMAIYVYNGNPRVRVSSDPIAIALSASAVVSFVRRVSARWSSRSG
jgi:hypothetical protein